MIDVEHEDLISLADVPTYLDRRGGKRPHVSCIYRWAQRGLRGVRLETIQVGGTKVTSQQALQRFFDRLTAAAENEAQLPRTSKQRERAAAQANSELEKAGW